MSTDIDYNNNFVLLFGQLINSCDSFLFQRLSSLRPSAQLITDENRTAVSKPIVSSSKSEFKTRYVYDNYCMSLIIFIIIFLFLVVRLSVSEVFLKTLSKITRKCPQYTNQRSIQLKEKEQRKYCTLMSSKS